MYMISFSMGTLVISVIIGQVSDMIAHANPGEKHQNDVIGMVHGLMHERKIPSLLTRKIRTHFSNLYKLRGTALDLWDDVIRMMPTTMGEELAVELGFLDNLVNGRRGVLTNVPFCQGLGTRDLMLIGCKLQHVKIQMHAGGAGATGGVELGDSDTAKPNQQTWIMKQGERDDRMFIILEGMVRVVRSAVSDGVSASQSLRSAFVRPEREEPLNLGKLHEFDYFGELGLLLRDDSGRPFPRLRSAFSITSTCILYTLNHGDLQMLRETSAAINDAISKAEDAVRQKRRSLGAVESGHRTVEDRLTSLESKMDTLIEMLKER